MGAGRGEVSKDGEEKENTEGGKSCATHREGRKFLVFFLLTGLLGLKTGICKKVSRASWTCQQKGLSLEVGGGRTDGGNIYERITRKTGKFRVKTLPIARAGD